MLAIMMTRQVFASALLAVFWAGSGCTDDAPDNDVDAAVPDGTDLISRLERIDGVVSVRVETAPLAPTAYVIRFEQPVDHGNPAGQRFTQQLKLLHVDFAAPMVVASTGYHDYLGNYSTEPARLLEANQVTIEHRFFGGSRPFPTDWAYLDIEQAAADHHRVIEALKSLYTGEWISTGGSKGGMTSIFHRRFYPDDVAGTIAYVAPISFSVDDPRYQSFFDDLDQTLGDECVERVRAVQRRALTERDALEEHFAGQAAELGYRFDRMGGLPRAFETAVIELEWTYWQYDGGFGCSFVPDATASIDDVAAFIEHTEVVWSMEDQHIQTFEPYYYQGATELGSPGLPHEHLADLLQFDYRASFQLIQPDGIGPIPPHDPAPMRDIADWLASEGERFIFVYGEYDPWTAGRFELGEARDSQLYVTSKGNHGALIYNLAEAEQQRVMDTLATWTGRPGQALSVRAVDETPLQAPRSMQRPRLGL